MRKAKRTRRGRGTIKCRDGKLYARFTHRLTGKRCMRVVRARTLREAESELLAIRHAVVNKGRPAPLEQTLVDWTVDPYLTTLRATRPRQRTHRAPNVSRAPAASIIVRSLARRPPRTSRRPAAFCGEGRGATSCHAEHCALGSTGRRSCGEDVRALLNS